MSREESRAFWESHEGGPIEHEIMRFSDYLLLPEEIRNSPDAKVFVTWVLKVECDLCGVLAESKIDFVDDPDGGPLGTASIPEGEKVLLAGDGEDLLNAHWDEHHPGLPRVMITDGQHRRMAPKGLCLP